MKAMILAAGHGTRLRPLTENISKCMVVIEGKPILEHNIDWLVRNQVTDIMINLNYLPETITRYFGDGSKWGARLTYSLEDEVLGTAGGVKKVSWFFDGPFIVWYGDNLSRCRLDALRKFHITKQGLVTMAVSYRPDVSQSGIVELDSNDRITRFVEKPAAGEVFSNWVNAGIYVLEPRVLDLIPADGKPDFGRDVFPALLKNGEQLYGYRMSEAEGLKWIDTSADLERVRQAGLRTFGS